MGWRRGYGRERGRANSDGTSFARTSERAFSLDLLLASLHRFWKRAGAKFPLPHIVPCNLCLCHVHKARLAACATTCTLYTHAVHSPMQPRA